VILQPGSQFIQSAECPRPRLRIGTSEGDVGMEGSRLALESVRGQPLLEILLEAPESWRGVDPEPDDARAANRGKGAEPGD